MCYNSIEIANFYEDDVIIKQGDPSTFLVCIYEGKAGIFVNGVKVAETVP